MSASNRHPLAALRVDHIGSFLRPESLKQAFRSFALGPEIAPGVPALLARSDKPLAMALKSGNFGDEAFFAKSLDVLGSR